MNPIEVADSKSDKQFISAKSCDPRQSLQPPRNQSDEIPESRPKLE